MLRGLLTIQDIQTIIFSLPAIIVAFTLHEFMHAYVAVKLGDPTPANEGRLTLNPVPHIDFVGFLMVILLGFGWAKPVRIRPNNFSDPRKGNRLVALAGPLTNLVLAFIFYGFVHISGDLPFMQIPWVMQIIQPFIWINVMLFAFNLLPIPPLDGFNILNSLVTFKDYRVVMNLRRYGFMILIVLSIFGIIGRYMGFIFGITGIAFSAIFNGIDSLVGMIG